MTDSDRASVVDFISTHPSAGIVLDGGVRKVRIPKSDTGKSGGYRVISYFMTAEEPVYLLTVINKTKTENLTGEQKKAVQKEAKAIKDTQKAKAEKDNKRKGK